jgi:uncharacterized membrane protein YcaP (DUF421 family)
MVVLVSAPQIMTNNSSLFSDLTHLSVPPIDLIIRAAAVYFFVLILLRLSGKRALGQMSPTEFVAILLVSNAVQNAMNAGDNSLLGGIILATVLIFSSWLISALTFRSRKVSAIFEGTPTLLVHHGKLIEANLKKERLNHSELRSLLRKQGIHSMSEVQSLILEANGTLSAIRVGEREAQIPNKS